MGNGDGGMKGTVLVVEDDPFIREWLSISLESEDYRVVLAEDGRQGVAQFEAHRPEVVLVDAMMPELDGFETCRLIRRREAERRVALLMMTGMATGDAEMEKAFRYGADEFIFKPLQWPVLRNRLRLILDQQQLERQLRQAKGEAEEAGRLKDKFVSLVAHDLRSPLSAMVGILEYLQDPQEAPGGDLQRQMLGELLSSGNTLISLIEDVLNIGRLRSGKMTPHKVFFDGRTMVARTVGLLEPLAERKGVVLENRLPEGVRLHGDPALLGEVLQNLVSNAIKFSQSGGRVTISVPEGSRSAIQVADRGVGIDPAVLPRLFSVEEKVTTRGTAGERGTGFGLPFSFDIMRAHGGRLEVDSTPGEGSVFRAVLPRVQPRVLVVDDQEGDRLVMSALLVPLDVEVVEAANGEEALRRFQEAPCHLVLSDVIMPKMDGFTLLERLNALGGAVPVPVMLVTADEQVETRDRAFRAGAADYLTKPLVVHDFIPRVRHLLG